MRYFVFHPLQDQVVEFSLPDPLTYHLSLAPLVAKIKPDSSRRVTIWFSPPVDDGPTKDDRPVDDEVCTLWELMISVLSAA